jgi:hypothetical protein
LGALFNFAFKHCPTKNPAPIPIPLAAIKESLTRYEQAIEINAILEDSIKDLNGFRSIVDAQNVPNKNANLNASKTGSDSL